MKFPKIFYSKLFLAVLIVAVLVGGALEYKQYSDRRQIDREIASLEAEERRLTEANQQLEQSIGFLSSPEYQEKLARLQLNLQKPGEIVVNFPGEQHTEAAATTPAEQPSNLYKWWEYIFIN